MSAAELCFGRERRPKISQSSQVALCHLPSCMLPTRRAGPPRDWLRARGATHLRPCRQTMRMVRAHAHAHTHRTARLASSEGFVLPMPSPVEHGAEHEHDRRAERASEQIVAARMANLQNQRSSKNVMLIQRTGSVDINPHPIQRASTAASGERRVSREASAESGDLPLRESRRHISRQPSVSLSREPSRELPRGSISREPSRELPSRVFFSDAALPNDDAASDDSSVSSTSSGARLRPAPRAPSAARRAVPMR